MSKKDKFYIAFLLSLPIIVFYPMFIQGKILFWLDMFYYFMPFRLMCAESIRNGILPLWNPYIYCGNPLLANMQSAVFYPLNILFYIFPFKIALPITTYITFSIMSIYFYFFMKLNNATEEASLLGSLLFTFNFYMLVKAVELADLNVMSWLPAILYYSKRYIESNKIYDIILLILIISLSFLGGHPQVFAYILILLFFYLFYEIFIIKRNFFKFIKINTLILFFLFFIISIQLLPTIDFILKSTRNTAGIGLSESRVTYIHFEQILQFFFPFIVNLYEKSETFYNWVNLIIIGLPGVFIFLLASFKIKDYNFRIYWLIIFTVVLFICLMGSMDFYDEIYNRIKILQFIRYVSKINIILLFIISVFSAYGFDLIFDSESSKLIKFFKIVVSVFLILIFVYFILYFFSTKILKFYKDTFNPLMTLDDIFAAIDTFSYFLNSYLKNLIILLIFIVFLYFIIIYNLRNFLIRILFLGFFIFSFMFENNFSPEYINFNDLKKIPQITNQIVSTENMKNIRILSPWLINFLKADYFFNNKEDMFSFIKKTLFPNIPMFYKIKNVDGFDSLYLGNFFKLKSKLAELDAPWESDAFRLLSTKYIISKKRLSGKNIKLKIDDYSYLYEYAKFLNIAFFVPGNAKIIFTDNDKQASNEIFEKPFNPLEKIIYNIKDKDYIIKLIKNNPVANFTNKKNTYINCYSKNLNNLTIEIESPVDGFLILTDNFDPGWAVKIDNKDDKIFEAYLCFKSVFLKKGKHIVEFDYKPFIINIGIIISVIILIFFLSYAIYNLNLKKKYEN